MSETSQEMSEEVEINLSPVDQDNISCTKHFKDTNEVDDVTSNQSKPSQPSSSVQCKPVNELTDEERQIVINNARAGIDQPYFDVRFFKNGKTRIVKKKTKQPTVSERVINESTAPTKKVYYSDNQLLMEHIIDLNSKFDRLLTKHKKLKRKYYNLRDDIYVDDDNVTQTQPVSQEEQSSVEQQNECIHQDEPVQQSQTTNSYRRGQIPRNWWEHVGYVY